jgi:hypothetical protein
MIAEQPYSDVLEEDGRHRRVIVPVWLRVPAHADIGEVADEDLVLECRRRGYAVFAVGRDIEIPGLRIRGDRPFVVWRGEERRLAQRPHGVLRVLAGAYPGAIGYTDLAWLLLRSRGDKARRNVQVIVWGLRRRFPGLIRTVTQPGGGTRARLVLDPGYGPAETDEEREEKTGQGRRRPDKGGEDRTREEKTG